MKISFVYTPAHILFLLAMTACSSSSKKFETPKKVSQEPGSWDYSKIRESRVAEAEDLSSMAADSDDYTKCQIYSKEAMVRAQMSGCRPTDPRDGFGENSYCCLPQK